VVTGGSGAPTVSWLRSLSRAVVGNRGAFFQRRLNLPALLSAQGREPESVLCSQCTNNFCRDHRALGGGGQADRVGIGFDDSGIGICGGDCILAGAIDSSGSVTVFGQLSRSPIAPNTVMEF
jgi:hypothetical protein